MDWPSDTENSGYYAFEPERFLIPPMEGFLRRIFAARWGMILVSGPEAMNLPVILNFLANFALQQVYYSEFSAQKADFQDLESERRRLRTIEEVLEEAREAVSRSGKEEGETGEYSGHIPRNSDVVFISDLRPELVSDSVATSLGGRLVVSGIRSEGSFPALRAFKDLLGSDHLVAASLMGIIGLNVVSRICPECKVEVEYDLDDEDCFLIGMHRKKLQGFRGMGCESCQGSGYMGKILIHEGFEMSPKLRNGLLESLPLRQLRILAKQEGMRTLLDATWDLADAGETTLDEVIRIADVTDPGGIELADL